MTTEEKEIKEEKKRTARPKPVERVKIKLIKNDGSVVLIEWIDDIDVGGEELMKSTMRGTVPMKECDWIPGERFGTAARSTIDAAIPYGIDWAEFKPEDFNPELFAAEMREHGIWTGDHLLQSAGTAIVLLQKNMKLNKGSLFSFVRNQIGGK